MKKLKFLQQSSYNHRLDAVIPAERIQSIKFSSNGLFLASLSDVHCARIKSQKRCQYFCKSPISLMQQSLAFHISNAESALNRNSSIIHSMQAPKHTQEHLRLEKLRELNILDTASEATFDNIVELASRICEAPISLMSMIDGDRQWFKSETGAGMRGSGLENAICAHTIVYGDYLEINDASKDSRTMDMGIVASDPNIRFYAGAVLKHPSGLPLGALCVLDVKPRALTDFQRFALCTLRDQINMQIELRRALEDLKLAQKEVDHRVKNSLQLISTMIRLQATRSTDDEVRSALASATQRVESIASLHETIYKSQSALSVSAAELFDQAIAMFRASTPPNVHLEILMPDVQIPTKIASSVLIAVSEFITNSCKHAFAGSDIGLVQVTGDVRADRLVITCSDNGIGMSEERNRKGLGMRIIEASILKLGETGQWSSSSSGTQLQFSTPISTS